MVCAGVPTWEPNPYHVEGVEVTTVEEVRSRLSSAREEDQLTEFVLPYEVWVGTVEEEEMAEKGKREVDVVEKGSTMEEAGGGGVVMTPDENGGITEEEEEVEEKGLKLQRKHTRFTSPLRLNWPMGDDQEVGTAISVQANV